MDVSPLKSYREPAFPTRRMLDLHPELLRLMPRRWRHNHLVLTALTTCGLLSAASWAQTSAEIPSAQQIAPIFQHGGGSGAFGCVVVNPPVFLSEADARLVVSEEARRLGLTFTPDKPQQPNARVPITDSQSYAENSSARWRKTTLAFDGEDRSRKVAYEFVSEQDFAKWETRVHQRSSTVSRFDLAGTAERLRQGLEKSDIDVKTGIFYDPGVGYDDIPQAMLVHKVPLVPLRQLAEWLGAKLVAEKGKITVTHGKTELVFTPNSAQAMQDGRPITLPVAMTVRKDIGFVPAETLVAAFGVHNGYCCEQGMVTFRHPDYGELLHLPIAVIIDEGKEIVVHEAIDRKLQHESAVTLAHEEVRKQVRDFVVWLKGQGVI